MAIDRLFRRLSNRILSKDHPGNGLFLNDKSFRLELARERMRVDRNGSLLALLVIELPANRATPRDFDFLSHTLRRRLRITDTIGILSNGRVGVLLPDTSKSGAWKVASDVCSVYPVGTDRPSCEVFAYPEEDSRRRNAEHSREREPVESSATGTVETFFATPTPRWKRTIDVLGAITGLSVTLPLLVLIGVAVKATSRGPILYSQEREGLGGKRFRIYKFRTMRLNAEQQQAALRPRSDQDGPAFKMRHDPRITWIGSWLRMTSLDELPQLWNVLRGEMSLVGPRPLPTSESLDCRPWQRQRLSVVPGMTCIWQVRGRNTVTFDQWMRMDLQYVRRRSLLRDMQLLLSTAPAIVLSRGPR
jgi:lipopolysaccharide/colanic/teichoic acid biosynthesis glycosyltransferase